MTEPELRSSISRRVKVRCPKRRVRLKTRPSSRSRLLSTTSGPSADGKSGASAGAGRAATNSLLNVTCTEREPAGPAEAARTAVTPGQDGASMLLSCSPISPYSAVRAPAVCSVTLRSKPSIACLCSEFSSDEASAGSFNSFCPRERASASDSLKAAFPCNLPDGVIPKYNGPLSPGALSSLLSWTLHGEARVCDNASPRLLRKTSATECSGVPGVIGAILIVSFLHPRLRSAAGLGQHDDAPGAPVQLRKLRAPLSPKQPAGEPESQVCKLSRA